MTGALWLKLLRDVRAALLTVGLLLMVFELFWVLVTQRITTQFAPLLDAVTLPGLGFDFFRDFAFRGPGEVFRALLGGDTVEFQNPNQLLTIGYIHPLAQTMLCIWAVGRCSGAIAGEIDKGTMELLLAQPVARTRVILAHLGVDLVAIPLLCLCMLAGTYLGLWIAGPFEVDLSVVKELPVPVNVPEEGRVIPVSAAHVPAGLWNVAALLFAVGGYSMWLSARGRLRWWVMGQAVVITLIQFIVNVLGQLFEGLAFLRPLTVFYYYQPQRIMLAGSYTVELGDVWNGGEPLLAVNVLAVLFAVGAAGYLMAWRTFTRRDIPAPL